MHSLTSTTLLANVFKVQSVFELQMEWVDVNRGQGVKGQILCKAGFKIDMRVPAGRLQWPASEFFCRACAVKVHLSVQKPSQ